MGALASKVHGTFLWATIIGLGVSRAPSGEELTATRLTIVDQDGKARITLGIDDESGPRVEFLDGRGTPICAVGFSEGGAKAGLYLLNDQGKNLASLEGRPSAQRAGVNLYWPSGEVSASLVTLGEELAGLRIATSKGAASAYIVEQNGLPQVAVCDSTGIPTAVITRDTEDASYVSVFRTASDGEVNLAAQLASEGTDFGGVRAMGPDQKEVVSLGNFGDQVAAVRMSVENKPRVLLASEVGGEWSTLQLMDRDKQPRVLLGVDPEGTPEARLCSDSGEVVWSAP